MRFIGNKENCLQFLDENISKTGIKGGTFCDFFSGTANVGRYFKKKGFRIISSDLLYFSYVLQCAYIKNNRQPRFNKLIRVLGDKIISPSLFSAPLESVLYYLSNIGGVKGFIYNNYTEEGTSCKKYIRKFFTGKNGEKIDAIRQKIESWRKSKIISNNEYFVLLASLIESVPYYANISGVYAAFLKQYDPRALKLFKLRPINICENGHHHKVYCGDSMKMISNLKADIIYLDPPYNGRQYAPNYHLLETIARYDSPRIRGVVGLREYSSQKSDFCNKSKALLALNRIAQKGHYRCLALSYNSEGIMPSWSIMRVLRKYGEVELVEQDYRRFKSNNNGDSKHRKLVKEQLYILRANRKFL